MTSQSQATMVQAQAMMIKDNRDIAPHPYQEVTTMASCLKDFSRINPPNFYGSKVDENPQEFIDEVYKILYAMGVSSSEKVELAKYQLKDMDQTWYV